MLSMRRSSRLAALLAWLVHSCTAPVCPAAERCTAAQAVESPCAGVLMPREWAIEAAACKKARAPAPAVAKAPAAWYSSPWFAFALGVPVGGALVWAATR